jgi:hypothetical protein
MFSAFLLLIMAGAVVARGSRAPHRLISSLHRHDAQSAPKQLTCLPEDVGTDDIVENDRSSKAKVTVGKKLSEMKARCHKAKLVDRKGREIRFFHISCWGNPPPDYLEIQQQEQAQLAKLKLRYPVIVLGCNPFSQ